MTDTLPGTASLTVACRICGGPLTLDAPIADETTDSGKMLAAIVSRCSKIACHDACMEDANLRKLNDELMQQVEERNKRWLTICPPEFRQQIDFKRANRALHDKIVGWQFGARGILAHGATGRCKTRFMFKLCEREFAEGRSITVVTHIEFRQMATRAAQNDPLLNVRRLMDMMTKCAILFIDDLGKGNNTPAAEETLFAVVDYRTRFNKPMLFTTNERLETLGARLSDDRSAPILRRIVDSVETIAF